MDQLEGLEGLTEIGRGGFGVVYRATETDLNRTVAVKVLNEATADLAQKRLDRERRAMGVLSGHPNIVTIYRTGTTGGSPYLVMEFLGGGSLEDRLRQGPPISWQEAVNIGTALADAVEAAHQAGVLHRDIKPANVLLSDAGVPKLGDFGIANVDAVSQTSGVMKATVAHAPPEVLSGHEGDARADVYSLASTIYELITGRPAFVRPEDTSPVPVLMRITSEAVPDIDAALCPLPVTRCLQQAMAKDPNRRPATAADFRQFLLAAASGQAPPPNVAPTGPPAGQATVVTPLAAPPSGAPIPGAPIHSAPGQPSSQGLPAPPGQPSSQGLPAPPGQQPPPAMPTTTHAPASSPPSGQQHAVHAFAPQPGAAPQSGGVPPQTGGVGQQQPPYDPPQHYSGQTTSSAPTNRALPMIIGGVVAALVVIAGAAFVLTRGDDPEVIGVVDPAGGDTTTATGSTGSTETTAQGADPTATVATQATPDPDPDETLAVPPLIDTNTVAGRTAALDLLVTGQLATTPGFESIPGYDTFEPFSDDAGVVTVEVPVEWGDRLDATEFGQTGIQIATDLIGTQTGMAESGVVVFVYERSTLEFLFGSTDSDDLIDGIIDVNEIDCDETPRQDFSHPLFAGRYSILTDCTESEPELMGAYLVGALAENNDYIMQVTLLTSDPSSIAGAQHAFDSIRIQLANL